MRSSHLALLVGQVPPAVDTLAMAASTRSSAVSSGRVVGGVLDHRDDVDQRLVVAGLVRPLQVLLGEALGRLVSVSRSSLSASVLQSWGRPRRIRSASIVLGVLTDEAREGLEVVLGLVLRAVGALDQPLRLDTVSVTPWATMKVRRAAGS